jgi:hypothetical protein
MTTKRLCQNEYSPERMLAPSGVLGLSWETAPRSIASGRLLFLKNLLVELTRLRSTL